MLSRQKRLADQRIMRGRGRQEQDKLDRIVRKDLLVGAAFDPILRGLRRRMLRMERAAADHLDGGKAGFQICEIDIADGAAADHGGAQLGMLPHNSSKFFLCRRLCQRETDLELQAILRI